MGLFWILAGGAALFISGVKKDFDDIRGSRLLAAMNAEDAKAKAYIDSTSNREMEEQFRKKLMRIAIDEKYGQGDKHSNELDCIWQQIETYAQYGKQFFKPLLWANVRYERYKLGDEDGRKLYEDRVENLLRLWMNTYGKQPLEDATETASKQMIKYL